MATRPVIYDGMLGGYRRHRINALLRKRFNGSTWTGLAMAVGACYGVDVSIDMADYALWNHTGYPGFWNENIVQECRQQLAEFFKDVIERGWEAATDDGLREAS